MTKYAIAITEKTLDLIQVLNGGVRPLILGDDNYYFVFQVDGPTSTTGHEIKREDDLYDGHGQLITPLRFLL